MPVFDNGIEGVKKKQLQNINPNKATGPDEITPKVLKECAVEDAFMLTVFSHQFLDPGQLPDDWEEGQVTATHRNGLTASAANNCPISMTCISCKVMEHIILPKK